MNAPHSRTSPLRVCMQCGFTYAEFLARGLLGCAACYHHLGDVLIADMLQMHPCLHSRAPAAFAGLRHDAPADDAALTAALRERLSDALRLERYEEAAAIRRQLDALAHPASRRSVTPGTP